MNNQCSGIFEEVFDSGCGGCLRTCVCGKTYYDTYNVWDWDEGEMEALEKDPNAIPRDYAIGTMSIGGEEIVLGCDCGRAKKYEDFIIGHATQLAEYLNKKSEMLKEKAASIEVKT